MLDEDIKEVLSTSLLLFIERELSLTWDYEKKQKYFAVD